jgi:hypothetical protein
MSDPISMGALGGVVLTEGIKFLYKQAGEILKGWRERRAAAGRKSAESAPAQPDIVESPLLEGRLSADKVDYQAVERLEIQLREVRQELSGYADGIDPVDTADKSLLAKVDALRQMLEAVYQQRITFKGEHRPAGPTVEGRIDVEQVAGYVAGVRARAIAGGKVSGEVKAKTVEGEAAGVDADRIG